MAQPGSNVAAVEIIAERRKLKRELTLLPLFGLIYFTVSGGSFGIEALSATTAAVVRTSPTAAASASTV